MGMDLRIDHDEAQQRYLLFANDTVVAYADYRLSDDATVATFHHTVTIPEYRGNGFAAELVQRALDDVRARDRKVEPTCWYVDGYINDHAEYADLRA